VESTAPSETPGSLGSRLPANLLLNLVPLTLVCLQHCASMTSSSVALEVDNSDSTSSITSLVNKHLFEAAVELLVAVPEIITDMLSLLQKIMSGMTSRQFSPNFHNLGYVPLDFFESTLDNDLLVSFVHHDLNDPATETQHKIRVNLIFESLRAGSCT